jgi:5'-methylthioadenosine phosphorylase
MNLPITTVSMVKVGIIGGTGLDDPKLLKNAKEVRVKTEFGSLASAVTIGEFKGVDVAILARHGKSHSVYPTCVNYRANIRALQKLGCTHILATTAVGSLRAEIKPGDIVFPNQFIDFTKLRNLTYIEDKVVHTSLADPFCGQLINLLYKNSKDLRLPCHKDITVITIEGPRFSTRAESHMFRMLGADIINMTTLPEVIFAREAKMCYSLIGMNTDYDCWKDDEEPVTWEMIVTRMQQNVSNVKKLLLKVIPQVKKLDSVCKCRS